MLARHGLEVRGDAAFPRQLAPSADALVSSPDFTYEPKWDGFRVLAGGPVRPGCRPLLEAERGRSRRLTPPIRRTTVP
jgi:hypothetical protein